MKKIFLTLILVFGFTGLSEAKMLQNGAGMYLKVNFDVEAAYGPDLIFVESEKDATNFIVKSVNQLGYFSAGYGMCWTKKVLFVSPKVLAAEVLNMHYLNDKLLYLGCDEAGDLKLFPLSASLPKLLKQEQKDAVLWTVSNEGVVDTFLTLGKMRFVVEPHFFDGEIDGDLGS